MLRLNLIFVQMMNEGDETQSAKINKNSQD